ncbi:MAG: DUF551 domain-containing protein [Methanolobus sp.]|nr:DUF551 domain-containing protein [Methanolobus sp.]
MNWIDKNKQMPPIGEFEDVSVYVHVTNGKLIGHGTYDYDRKVWTYHMTSWSEQDDNEITHWMPLLKLPSENIVYTGFKLDELKKIEEKLSWCDDERVGYDSWKSEEFLKFCEIIEQTINDADASI